MVHLFSDSFASFNINVEHEGHKHSFRVAPTLSLKGLHVLIEEKLKCSDFTICTTTSEQPLSESYTLEACGITETTSLMVIIDTVPEILSLEESGGNSLLKKDLDSPSLPLSTLRMKNRSASTNKPPNGAQLSEGSILKGLASTQNVKRMRNASVIQKG